MDIKAEIELLREEFNMANMNNTRVMKIIDELWQDNQRLRQLLNAKHPDIDDDEQ
jgi:hypothetical protein